ncbi:MULTISPECIES: aminotransferase class V-fold PLP-dependent enzyme [unclassified Streptomyces]|uniref:kynureninase n=1 Tax=unclassified Streptomyces TaxID=2593676 RepID=UPI002DD963E0|nr:MULTISPECIES: aminotransferase class V-fold PLP-dependent enzyme [unclassified Streptomyces]WSA93476.1 aminotransferase class V-fold PLP-dependent enzyme [Streptomyces sp. NBC_01795]WSB77845.1 aminotransferase class V-fold PLP-dependent enzyme [Streptomyces sp. NBC_01775]WSS13907.1 aminotransferase class V-fold PLP-dependent enzyme [Streptomyces sp. NBC_01186]WSS42721.1 aminotransferase class V-fold PLP-dependent enzyme [Streptomyces sp. NBC_01187]
MTTTGHTGPYGTAPVGTELDEVRKLDADDPLAAFRARFAPVPEGLIFLNGASLGRLPADTADETDALVRGQWGERLAQARTQWLDLPQRVGDELAATVLGARPGEVVASDCTSVNLYKLGAAALRERPGAVVMDDDNFPTDQYVLAGLAEEYGRELRSVRTDPDLGPQPGQLRTAVEGGAALVSLSLVSHRSGALKDIRAVQEIAHAAGALVLWDLSHAVGAVPLRLTDDGADLAVGSTYKHLCGGPGAPALLYVREGLQARLTQPVQGWYGHREQLAMRHDFDPDPSIRRFLTGSPPVLSLAALRPALRLLGEAGMERVRAKSLALTGLFQRLAADLLEPHGFRLAGPADPAARGGHLTYAHPRARALVPLLAERAGVLVDYGATDRLRASPAPLSTRFEDVYEAVHRIRHVLDHLPDEEESA